MRTLTLTAILMATAAAAAPSASAQISELRGGVMAHNICVVNCKNADKEDGPNLQAELVFDSPDLLRYILSPRPYLIASLNASGDTSYGGIGLHWNIDFAQGWSLEPGLGYVIHDGETENPFGPADPRRVEFGSENVLFGSEDLFRSSLSLNRDFGPRWVGQITFEHLSHGQILGDGRNQGSDSLGVRVGYRF